MVRVQLFLAVGFGFVVVQAAVGELQAPATGVDANRKSVVKLILTAGGDGEGQEAAAALHTLKELGLAEQVVPVLAGRDSDAEMIAVQRAAVRVLQQSQFLDALDALGRLIATPRYSWPDDATRIGWESLRREAMDAIYALAGRQSPVHEGMPEADVDELVAPALRMVSVLKPATARQTNLPADDPRRGLRVRLRVDKGEWLLGESVMIHYEVVNEGDRPAKIDMGGDHRTSPQRHLRFKVVAFDERGVVVEDPYPERWCFGGMGGPRELKPGASFWEGIPLWRHCAIVRPGTYTIRVYHDLGWDGEPFASIEATHPPLMPHLAPVVETKISFREPTPDEARDVLTAILNSPPTDGRMWGERAESFGEVTSIRSLVYVPLIRERVHLGEESAMDALGTMPFAEATQELVELAQQGSPSSRQRAMQLLLQRLPNGPVQQRTRRWLARKAWRDEFRSGPMELAWELLRKDERESIIMGADIVAAIGSAEDLPRMIKFADRVLIKYHDDEDEQAKYPRPANASGRVIGAASQLLARGGRPPAKATSAATGLIMLFAIGRDEKFRPDDWVRQVQELARHPIPHVRATVLERLPPSEASAFGDTIVEALEDAYLPVKVAACNQAGKLKLPAAAAPLMKLLKKENDQWLINAAYEAALACGAPRDRVMEICIERLSDSEQGATFVRRLILVLDTNGGSSESQVDWSVAPRLQREWRKLLEAERERIAAGEKLSADEPPVTPALFPRGFTITRVDGSSWPDWEKIPADAQRP